MCLDDLTLVNDEKICREMVEGGISCRGMKTNPTAFIKFVTEKREWAETNFLKEGSHDERRVVPVALDLFTTGMVLDLHHHFTR